MPQGTRTLFTMYRTRGTFSSKEVHVKYSKTGDISALNYGETPYETEDQIRRGDSEERKPSRLTYKG